MNKLVFLNFKDFRRAECLHIPEEESGELRELCSRALAGDSESLEYASEIFWKNISKSVPKWEEFFKEPIISIDYKIGENEYRVYFSKGE